MFFSFKLRFTSHYFLTWYLKTHKFTEKGQLFSLISLVTASTPKKECCCASAFTGQKEKIFLSLQLVDHKSGVSCWFLYALYQYIFFSLYEDNWISQNHIHTVNLTSVCRRLSWMYETMCHHLCNHSVILLEICKWCHVIQVSLLIRLKVDFDKLCLWHDDYKDRTAEQ